MMELFSRVVAILMLIVISPLLLLISIGSIVSHGLPIFFKQERVGFNFKPFMLCKFRTMKVNSGSQPITKLKDSRITIYGNMLRTLKLDELPQLWNIVNGKMRFIGPRPEIKEYVNHKDFSFLTEIKPGLTDFSSIILRNEVEILSYAGGVDKYPDLVKLKVELGHLYAEYKSFWLDMMLVILTIVSIPFPKIAIIF